jgi:hypothetical protein
VAQIEMAIDDTREIRLADTFMGRENFAPGRKPVRMTGNVRSVGFISKPGQIQELKTCMAGPLLDLLQPMPGFAGALILHAYKESRNLLMLTFWETEGQAASNCWEEFSKVRKLLSPLIDVCTKVQTFQATMPQIIERRPQGKSATVC